MEPVEATLVASRQRIGKTVRMKKGLTQMSQPFL
jgi:hypothetical protein